MKKQMFRERECIHREEGPEGDFYNGEFYVQALQRLPIDQAMHIASKVAHFSGSMRRTSWSGSVTIALMNSVSLIHRVP